jgi:hypothetical protein
MNGGIHEVTINDIDCRVIDDPCVPKLRVCAVGDEVFLTIVTVDDTNKHYKATPIAEVAVRLEDLKAALGLVTDWKA